MFHIQMMQSLGALSAIVMILIGSSWIKQAAWNAIR
jgi:hypothetical protein